MPDPSTARPSPLLRATSFTRTDPSATCTQALRPVGNSCVIDGSPFKVAAQTLALTMVELLQNPELVAAAKREMERRRGENFVYQALLVDRAPPLDYRLN